MAPKLVLNYWLLLVLFAYPLCSQAEALPLDLIELLGELDDEDNALEAALTEIEIKKAKVTTPPNEVNK